MLEAAEEAPVSEILEQQRPALVSEAVRAAEVRFLAVCKLNSICTPYLIRFLFCLVFPKRQFSLIIFFAGSGFGAGGGSGGGSGFGGGSSGGE